MSLDEKGATYLALGTVGAGVLGGGNGEAIALRRLFSADVMLALFSKVDAICTICALLNVFRPFLLFIRFLKRCRPRYGYGCPRIEICMMEIMRVLLRNPVPSCQRLCTTQRCGFPR